MDNNIIKQETISMGDKIKMLVVCSQVTYETACEMARDIIHFRKKIESHYKPMLDKAVSAKRAAEESRKAVLAQQGLHVDPVLEVEKELKRKIRKYEDDKAENERIAKAEADRKALELSEKAEEEAFAGNVEEAEETLKEAENQELIADTVEGSTISHISGAGIRRNWDVEITNEELLPRSFLVPDLIKLRAEARQMKENFLVPGAKSFIKEI